MPGLLDSDDIPVVSSIRRLKFYSFPECRTDRGQVNPGWRAGGENRGGVTIKYRHGEFRGCKSLVEGNR